MKNYAGGIIICTSILAGEVLLGGCIPEKRIADKPQETKKVQISHPQPASLDSIVANLREGVTYLQSGKVGPDDIQFQSGKAYFMKQRATLDSDGKWTGVQRPSSVEVKASIIMVIRELAVGYLKEIRSGDFDESREQIIAISRDAGTYASYITTNTNSSDLKKYVIGVFPLLNQAQLRSDPVLLDDAMDKFIKLDKALFGYTGGNLLKIAEEFKKPYRPPSTQGVKISDGIMVQRLNNAKLLPVQRKAAVRAWIKQISHSGVSGKGVVHFANVEDLKNSQVYLMEDEDIARKLQTIKDISEEANQMNELPELKWYVDDLANLLRLAKLNRSRHQYYQALVMINELNDAVQP
ncbi:hypothetical protein PP175_00580 [Aneurinibacillus sp. Ricciae_BoGa-3]|uniref:hypothetical protein n=1 Tax=Aneurinibacillus sp. Ricciae_BoGa-3 TaxID=3022697 RepID=UPI0023413F59|nr:hypothetical protein [Aneurinibacillus sp. Ricciae_BoGa-3]WCK54596.1 hypothetical protein PP175_00580 [Aneurinibacillus sp. Ricciae_BoGa-3]